jgi:hypothetical protein
MEDNLKSLSKRQLKRAKQARELYEAMGTPTVDDLTSEGAFIWVWSNSVVKGTEFLRFGLTIRRI